MEHSPQDFRPERTERGPVREPWETYYDEIYAIPLLKREEEASLMQRKDSEVEARNRIIVAYLRIVPPIALSLTQNLALVDDLIGVGNLALMEAVKYYDPSRGTAFSDTHAKRIIFRAMKRALGRLKPPVRISIEARIDARKVRSALRTIERKQHREATLDEVGTQLKFGKTKCERLPEMMKAFCIALQKTEAVPHSLPQHDGVPVRHASMHEEQERVREGLDQLPDDQRHVLRALFEFDGTKKLQKELAAEMNTTCGRIKKTMEKALDTIRKDVVHG